MTTSYPVHYRHTHLSVPVLPLWSIHLKVVLVLETIPVLVCLQNSLRKGDGQRYRTRT